MVNVIPAGSGVSASGISSVVNAVETIVSDVTFQIAPSGGDFTEPGTFTEWLQRYRIMPGATVTANIASGTYTLTKAIIGHIDGARLAWTNAGLNGSPLTGSDFSALDSTFAGGLDGATGMDPAALATASAAAEIIVRANYKVIFEANPSVVGNAVIRCSGLHSGDWSGAPCLIINSGAANTGTGITTGTGDDEGVGDGPGGVGELAGSCFFGFKGNIVCDYGGIINFANGLSLFAGEEGIRIDFVGAVYADAVVILGCGEYGYRSNHGGSLYADSAYIHGNSLGVAVDNSPGMAWVHGSDIQYNYIGLSCQYGGSAKAAYVTNFLAQTTSMSGDGVTATVTFGASNVITVGYSITIIGGSPSGYAGTHIVTASSSGSVSFASTATGAQTVAGDFYELAPAKIKNNARIDISITDGGDIDARNVDMASTETYPINGSAPAAPLFGLSVLVGGSAIVDKGILTGHGRDLYMTDGSVSGPSATITVAQTAASVPLSPDFSNIYAVAWPRTRAPQTKTDDFTAQLYECTYFCNKAGALVVTLPSASANPGRVYRFQNFQAQTLASASANVVPKGNAAAATAILPATDGAWAVLESNGTYWYIVMSGT